MKRTVELSFFLAFALILAYVEALFPLPFGVPGMKLGLPNLIVLLLLYDIPVKNAPPSEQIQRVSWKRESEQDGTGAEGVEEAAFSGFLAGRAGEALLVNGLRIVLSGFLFGNLFAILYALSGAVLSFAAMQLGRRTGRLSMVGVSMLGGVFHNLGQLLAAMAVVETVAVAFYLPALILAGAATGAALGGVGMALAPYLRRRLQFL